MIDSIEITHTGGTAIIDIIIWATFIILGILIAKDRLFR